MEAFEPYGWAIFAMLLYGLVPLVTGLLTGMRKDAARMHPGQPFEPDYANPLYRLERTYLTSVEHIVIFLAVILTAMLAGVSPFWVNFVALLGLVMRYAATFFYLRGIGRPYRGPRTQSVGIASVGYLVLVVMTLIALLG